MTAPLTDKEIAALYKESANETSPDELDKKILDYARSQSAAKAKSPVNWWPYASLAAAVMLVAVISPWNWLDKTLPGSREAELFNLPPEQDASRIPESTEMLDAPAAQKAVEAPGAKYPEIPAQQNQEQEKVRARAMQKSAPMEYEAFAPAMQSDMADSELPASILNPFATVEALLEQSEEEKAQEALERLLKAKPELESELPESLEKLMGRNSGE